METTLSDHETRFVLGEMIKASSIDVSILADFIRAHNVEQNWMQMQLPTGRNMHQCMGAVEKMLPVRLPPHPTFNLNLKRKSLSDLVDPPFKKQAIMPPLESNLPPRNIQPRPPLNGFLSTPPVTSSSPPVTSTGKKRGRPSKADKEAQARANYSRTIEYTPITPAPAPTAPPLAPMALAPQREYAYSPGYEIAGSSAEKIKKRTRPNSSDQSPTVGTYHLVSPSSATETPRALPELIPIEQVGHPIHSPRDRIGAHPQDSRSPPLLPQLQHPSHLQPQPQAQGQTQAQSPPQPARSQPYQQTRSPVSIPQPPPRPHPLYEQYRSPDPPKPIDPIFPDRDRSKSASDHMSRDTPVTTPLVNRS